LGLREDELQNLGILLFAVLNQSELERSLCLFDGRSLFGQRLFSVVRLIEFVVPLLLPKLVLVVAFARWALPTVGRPLQERR